MAAIEVVFHEGDTAHPLAERFQHLMPERREGVAARPGYARVDPRAVLHRYPYDRAIISALADLGGLFVHHRHPRGDRVDFTDLGNIDLSFYDARGILCCYTVTHEGSPLSPTDRGGILASASHVRAQAIHGEAAWPACVSAIL